MSEYSIVIARKFKSDLKILNKRGFEISKLERIVEILENGVMLPKNYKNHYLFGRYLGKMECHIEPDWLLVYEIDEKNKILGLIRTGTHSDLF